MAMTRREAKMIAEELYKLIRPQVVAASKEVAIDESEIFLSTKEAAGMLGISATRLYKTKHLYGCYSKVNGRLRFSRNRLTKRIQTGI